MGLGPPPPLPALQQQARCAAAGAHPAQAAHCPSSMPHAEPGASGRLSVCPTCHHHTLAAQQQLQAQHQPFPHCLPAWASAPLQPPPGCAPLPQDALDLPELDLSCLPDPFSHLLDDWGFDLSHLTQQVPPQLGPLQLAAQQEDLQDPHPACRDPGSPQRAPPACLAEGSPSLPASPAQSDSCFSPSASCYQVLRGPCLTPVCMLGPCWRQRCQYPGCPHASLPAVQRYPSHAACQGAQPGQRHC